MPKYFSKELQLLQRSYLFREVRAEVIFFEETGSSSMGPTAVRKNRTEKGLGFGAEPGTLDKEEKYFLHQKKAIVGPNAYTKAVSEITKMPLYIVD